MRYLSVCSGIEAATVAWEPLEWEAEAFSEIDPFASAVLAHRFPQTKNLGDFTEIREHDIGPIDLLVGGTPCQDFSVAGLRAGLAGDRGQLTIEFLRLAARLRPEWVVWENVPGVLSADGGRAFGTFLGGLADIGYGFAYRVLDAQHFGVAQRRRRVFVVGCLGDWRRAAAVLFERASLSERPAPSRKAGQVAPTVPSRSSAGGGLGTDFDCDGGFSQRDAAVLRANAGGASGGTETSVAGTLRASGSGVSRVGNGEAEMLVAHTLKAEGHDASEDGTGRGTPLVVSAFTQNSRSEVRLIGGDGETVGAVTAKPGAQGQNYVAFSSKDYGSDASEIAPTLRSMNEVDGNQNGGGQLAGAKGGNNQSVAAHAAVRRLTPRECERLQGFPDDWTLVPDPRHKGALAKDQPRYHAIGNSMAVPVMRWIGERIDYVTGVRWGIACC